MRTKSRSRGRGLVLAVLTLIMSVPELARAQQSGLFPLAPIKRQRVPCDQEDPVYKIYKEKYFGYHPTCWRPFPTGWGCPSPEKPDVEKAFRERKVSPYLDTEGAGRQARKRRKAISLVSGSMFRLYLVAADRHLNSPHPTQIDPEMHQHPGQTGRLPGLHSTRNPPIPLPERPMRLELGRPGHRARRLVMAGLS